MSSSYSIPPTFSSVMHFQAPNFLLCFWHFNIPTYQHTYQLFQQNTKFEWKVVQETARVWYSMNGNELYDEPFTGMQRISRSV